MSGKVKRIPTMLNCAACAGTGEWLSPAVRRTDKKFMPAQTLACVSCEGTGLVEREIDEVES